MKSIATLTVLMLIAAFRGSAQYDATYTQYMFNEMFINPAYAGSKDAMSTTLLHRQQWVNFPGRPVTTAFTINGPIQDKNMGVGLSVLNEKIGVLNRNLIYASYSYRMKIRDNGRLALGLMGGLENQLNKFADVKVSNDLSAAADPQFSQNSPNVNAPNFGAGLYYNTKNLYVGLSVPRMIDNSVRFSSGGASVKTTRIAMDRFTYYLTAGYLFTLNSQLKLKANGMLQAVQNAPAQVNLGANFLMDDMIWAGLSYRSNSAVSVLLGIQANKQLLVCYSYDYSVNKIQRYSLGTHEIVINYVFSFTGQKVTTPRYF